ncbi:DUF4260 family protein [Streptomyces sp. NPDC056086]
MFLVPDLSWLAYLVGPRVGAWTYNLAHTAPLPLALLVAGAGWHTSALTVAGAVGLFHCPRPRTIARPASSQAVRPADLVDEVLRRGHQPVQAQNSPGDQPSADRGNHDLQCRDTHR